MAFVTKRNESLGERISKGISGAMEGAKTGFDFATALEENQRARDKFALEKQQLELQQQKQQEEMYNYSNNTIADLTLRAMQSPKPESFVRLNSQRLATLYKYQNKEYDEETLIQNVTDLKNNFEPVSAKLTNSIARLGSTTTRDADVQTAYKEATDAITTLNNDAPGLSEIWKVKQKFVDELYANRLKGAQDIAKERVKAELKPAAKPPKNVGQEAMDRDFAKEYSEYIAQGGSTAIDKNLKQLDITLDELKMDKSLTGSIRGAIPKSIRSITNPKAVAAMQRAQEVVTRNLRQVYGPQFTREEGQKLMEFTFDPQQPPAELVKRLERLKTQVKQQAKIKRAAAKFWEDNNSTLSGFKGTELTSGEDEEAPKAFNVNGIDIQLK